MFNKRTFFDGWTVDKNARVFASGGRGGAGGAAPDSLLTGKI